MRMSTGPDPVIAEAFDRHGPALLLYARQFVDAPAAEDVVQAVFLRLIVGQQKPVELRSWLFRCVRNEAISMSRSHRRRVSREQSRAGAASPWFVPGTDQAMDATAAEAALRELPAVTREVVTLRIWSGLTLSEISAVTGLATSTIHDHYRTAMRTLRERLEPSWKKAIR